MHYVTANIPYTWINTCFLLFIPLEHSRLFRIQPTHNAPQVLTWKLVNTRLVGGNPWNMKGISMWLIAD